MFKDKFGFWKINKTIAVCEYNIQPLNNFSETKAELKKYQNKDGFIYPPCSNWYQFSNGVKKQITLYKCQEWPNTIRENSLGKLLPSTQRPALLHGQFPSHQISSDKHSNLQKFRRGDGNFIINFLSFLYQTRLQFHDWWWEGRINLKQKPIAIIKATRLTGIITHAFDKWRSWAHESKKLMNNAIFLLQRGKALEWHFERYISYYIAIDALWKLGKTQKYWKTNRNKINHSKRLHVMCDELKLKKDNKILSDICDTRNTLFHEGFFGGLNPTSAKHFTKYEQTWSLVNLTERIIIGLLGLKPSFLSKKWWDTHFEYIWD